MSKQNPDPARTGTYTAMTASEYTALMTICYLGQSNAKTARAMQITEVTHTKWLKHGIRGDYNPTKADKNKAHVLAMVKIHQAIISGQAARIAAWLDANG